MKISYTFLIGDLIHYGHISLLKSAKENCDLHISGIINQTSAEKWLNPILSNYLYIL